MPVIVFASSKGGVGKSTTAMMFSQVLAKAGANVVLVDADPNSPFSEWERVSNGQIPNNFELMKNITEDTILDAIDEASARANFVIVDLEGSANISVGYAIGRADLVLLPVQGSKLDADEAAKVVRLISREERAYKRPIPYASFFTRLGYIEPRTSKHIRSFIEDAGVKILDVAMNERDAFRAVFLFGGTLYELSEAEVSQPDKAVANAEEFAQCVVSYLEEIQNA
jgi:chromosome partitioning protein